MVTMKLVAPLDRSMHRPFRIGDGESWTGPRIGGRAPALDHALPLVAGSQYVLTFPLFEQPVVYVSVFVNGEDSLWDAMNAGVQSDDRIVTVRHGDVPRGPSDRFESELSSHPLEVSREIRHDVIAPDGDDRQIISSVHKFGGRTHCIQGARLQGADELFDRGLVQVLQLDFPGREDGCVSGNWPFADGLFNLFMKPDEPALTYWAFQK
jgi:hypothetical protein